MIGYLGIMGEQDGVETMVRALAEIIHVRKRDDVHGLIIGDGPELQRLKKLASDLNLGDSVRFSGYLSGQPLLAHLSALNVGIIPDPPNEFNDKLSMNKVFEYMMLGLPIVQFNLRQATRDAADAALVVREHSPEALADGILALVDNPQRCLEMSALGKAVAEREFQWANEARRYLTAYRTVFRRRLDVNDKRHYPAS
ncbi:glycosyltransferase involved in cell wall biosynthesis [Rhizobium mesoamericanum]|nr:glycosyltransferase involved in cell wall biosynthesis [Rhizobium mesoamericanum]